jgi:hypothetical protein
MEAAGIEPANHPRRGRQSASGLPVAARQANDQNAIASRTTSSARTRSHMWEYVLSVSRMSVVAHQLRRSDRLDPAGDHPGWRTRAACRGSDILDPSIGDSRLKAAAGSSAASLAPQAKSTSRERRRSSSADVFDDLDQARRPDSPPAGELDEFLCSLDDGAALGRPGDGVVRDARGG